MAPIRALVALFNFVVGSLFFFFNFKNIFNRTTGFERALVKEIKNTQTQSLLSVSLVPSFNFEFLANGK